VAQPGACILCDVTWSGAATIEPGRLIYTGRLGSAHSHTHAAVQIAVTFTGTVVFTDVKGRSAEGSAGVIPSGAVHAINAGDATGVMIYIEPTSAVGRRLTALIDPAGHGDARAWTAAARTVKGADGLQASSEVADAVLHELVGAAALSPVSPPHPSVRRAIEVLPSLLAGPVRLTDVARTVHLSPDRLGRLFVREVGLSFSAYVRWLRLVRAMEAARGGSTITDAAHAAGFSDSSHANRVCHEMFGIGPIAAQRGVRLD